MPPQAVRSRQQILRTLLDMWMNAGNARAAHGLSFLPVADTVGQHALQMPQISASCNLTSLS